MREPHALREAKRCGHPTLAIVNTVGSTIAREADGGIYLHAGPEVGVASTKAFSAQVMVLTLLALHLGRLRQLSFADGQGIVDAIESLPAMIGKVLTTESRIAEAAERFVTSKSALFLGRDEQHQRHAGDVTQCIPVSRGDDSDGLLRAVFTLDDLLV